MPYFARGVGDPFPFAALAAAVPVARRIGGIVQAVGKAVGKSAGKHPIATAVGVGAITRAAGSAPPGQVPVPGIRGGLQRILPGGATGFMECPRGFHLDKKTQSYCVRNRSMNPANPRALNRAIRRVSGFGNLVKRSKQSVAAANRALNPGTAARRSSSRKCGCK